MAFRIKEFREASNMTQVELCKKAGVSRQVLYELESGKDVNTTITTLRKIVDALGCKLGDIFIPND